jgi:hypothetical protein
VSWGAVIGGAFVISAIYLILLALGAGFGLSAVSPWANAGMSAATAGVAGMIWLIVIEIIAAALGGYLTGRLRTKWTLVHTDEVFFRDTANGFLAWAVALVVSAALLASAATSMAGRTEPIRQAGEIRESVASAAGPNAYFIDELFRSERPAPESRDAPTLAEADRLFTNALRIKQMPSADRAYLTRLIMAKTGVDQAEADRRVSTAFAEAQQAEDVLRKATARLLLWLFLSMLIGAFCASYAATIGGRQRDHVRPVAA